MTVSKFFLNSIQKTTADTLGPSYNQFCYGEHPAITNIFLCIKIIDCKVKKFGYNENPFIMSCFLLHLFTRCKRDPVYISDKRHLLYLPSATKLRKGNIFTSVCQEFCPRGGGAGGLPRGVCLVCITACTEADTPRQNPPPADGYCCGRYASYWNAFLLIQVFFIILV